ncbi:hypothetical protein ASD51_31160 [Streptomyces sp. Root55]|uniref:hypothetical protein n=1 Tax=Streptomyces sp. Root55 TaxID=1736554 RepID=UPI0006FBFE3B|nr:hypothetical protein [Streptomyces sp. Root55]KQZ17653.1 hypothetical protein ASD51_31160 [Streptomyces sp. Root55]
MPDNPHELAALVHAHLDNDPDPQRAAAIRTVVDTCTRMLDMGYAEDDPASDAYRAGYYDGVLKPLADLYAAHPER